MKFLLGLLFLAVSASAGNPLSVKLVSETKSITPGETFVVGLHLKAPAGYHTYWKHPGIVGVATSVQWALPPGFCAGEIQWPAPQAVKMARYTAQGYYGECLLMVPITPPATLAAPSFTLEAQVSWMCCGERCHPASNIPVSISLPVSATREADPATKPLFERFRGSIPKKSGLWRIDTSRQGDNLALTLTSNDPLQTRDVADLGSIRFFTEDGQVDSSAPQKVTLGPGQRIQIDLRLSKESPPPRVAAVIVAERSWQRGHASRALELP